MTIRDLIDNVFDENTILQILTDTNAIQLLGLPQLIDILKRLTDSGKQQLLRNENFIKDCDGWKLAEIVLNLNHESIASVLMDNFDLFINKLQDNAILESVKRASNDELTKMILESGVISFDKEAIIKSFKNNANKVDALLKYGDTSFLITNVLATLDVETLNNFFAEHKDFTTEHNILSYEVISKLDISEQKKFVELIEHVNLQEKEKMFCLAVLNPDVKNSVDTTNLSEKYKTALGFKVSEYLSKKYIEFDFNVNPEYYRGLDDYLSIYPCSDNFTKEQRTKFFELCDICPSMCIYNDLDDIGKGDASSQRFSSTATEYKAAEEWINSLIDSIDPEYSQAQKLAIIDNAIGRKISYSPDFGTEVFSDDDCRALWKIIDSGYGVCNGIAKVEHYILNLVGIKSEVISSGRHSFLKIKDIELPLANGDTVKGDTILDPTWNLATHRYKAKPSNFCINYEQARQSDIDGNGNDRCAHKNDEKLKDVTLSLDIESLKKLFASVGLAKKDGTFPVEDFIEKSNEIHKLYADDPSKDMKEQFLYLEHICPEFATCQNSTISYLDEVVLDNENLNIDKYHVSRVYKKDDKNKRPVLYVYITSKELGDKFYYADKEKGKFIELSPKEFTQNFDCYEADLKLTNRS